MGTISPVVGYNTELYEVFTPLAATLVKSRVLAKSMCSLHLNQLVFNLETRAMLRHHVGCSNAMYSLPK
jgi:hypothetical protein